MIAESSAKNGTPFNQERQANDANIIKNLNIFNKKDKITS